MKNPSPGSCVGGFGRAGEGTVPMGPALTTMMRRAPAVFIAAAMARVPWVATPASEFDVAPSPESTASAPSTADSSDVGEGRQVGTDVIGGERQVVHDHVDLQASE